MRTARFLFLSLSVTSFVLASACTAGRGTRMSDSGPGTGADGGGGGGVDTGVPRPDANYPDTGIAPGSCSDGEARWIYLVDSDNQLLRFEPDTNRLTEIATIACASGATPFSMAVDRRATAYVLHSDHAIYQVSTRDGTCAPTGYTPDRMGFELFGMGFVSDTAGGTTETMFIAGGPELGIGGGSATLGSVDVSGWTVSTIGDVSGSPELTGNGNAELWGFFPDADPMAVRQMDRATGATIREFDVSSIDTGFFPLPSAWAFAFWGGRYYIFYQGAADTSTGIYRLTPDTGVVEPVMTDIGYRIVGAGVSTCAPTILI